MKTKQQLLAMKPTDEDRKLISALSKKTGVMSVSDLLRMALRALATKEGVNA